MGTLPELVHKELRKIGDFVFAIGYFSEIIMALITVYVLQKDKINLVIFIIFFLISGYLNTLLKWIIREPRPKDAVKYLYSEHFSRTQTIYGMPSGHSQNVFFSMMYLFLSDNGNVYWLQIGLIMATLMVYERWTFHNHTILQLLMGAIVGSLLAFIIVKIRDYIRKYYLGSQHKNENTIKNNKTKEKIE